MLDESFVLMVVMSGFVSEEATEEEVAETA